MRVLPLQEPDNPSLPRSPSLPREPRGTLSEEGLEPLGEVGAVGDAAEVLQLLVQVVVGAVPVLLPHGDKLWYAVLRRIDAELDDQVFVDGRSERWLIVIHSASARGRPGTVA